MFKGGYKIINLGVSFTPDEAKTVKGVHQALEASYKKPLLLSGIIISDVEYNDVYITYSVEDSTFTIKNVYGYDISITQNDEITFTAIVA